LRRVQTITDRTRNIEKVLTQLEGLARTWNAEGASKQHERTGVAASLNRPPRSQPSRSAARAQHARLNLAFYSRQTHQPQSGERMQPTAQAVGKHAQKKTAAPGGAKENAPTTDLHRMCTA